MTDQRYVRSTIQYKFTYNLLDHSTVSHNFSSLLNAHVLHCVPIAVGQSVGRWRRRCATTTTPATASHGASQRPQVSNNSMCSSSQSSRVNQKTTQTATSTMRTARKCIGSRRQQTSYLCCHRSSNCHLMRTHSCTVHTSTRGSRLTLPLDLQTANTTRRSSSCSRRKRSDLHQHVTTVSSQSRQARARRTACTRVCCRPDHQRNHLGVQRAHQRDPSHTTPFGIAFLVQCTALRAQARVSGVAAARVGTRFSGSARRVNR